MMDMEKFISGLLEIADWHYGKYEQTNEEDYLNDGDFLTAVASTLKEQKSLLKAQEPRVMTVSEIGALANGDVVWVEFTDGRLLPMMVEDGCLMRWRYLWRICEDAFYDEDYKARAWTSRPTDEQREKVKWE